MIFHWSRRSADDKNFWVLKMWQTQWFIFIFPIETHISFYSGISNLSDTKIPSSSAQTGLQLSKKIYAVLSQTPWKAKSSAWLLPSERTTVLISAGFCPGRSDSENHHGKSAWKSNRFWIKQHGHRKWLSFIGVWININKYTAKSSVYEAFSIAMLVCRRVSLSQNDNLTHFPY